MANTFTITGYTRATDTVTVTFVVDGTTYTGVKLQGLPKDSVESVKDYMFKYVEAFKAGKKQEEDAKTDIPNDVKDLLNKPTEI